MPRRVMQGTVVADAKNKTVVVTVERQIMHPIYKKFMRRTKRCMAHDENNVCKSGEIVRIRECRPLSKRKSWEVIRDRSEEHTPELQSLMRISYAVFCLKQKKQTKKR